MNKKMLGVFGAVALAGSVFGETAIESANVVGYEQYNAVVGFQIMPIQFKNVSGTSADVDVMKYIDYSMFKTVRLSEAKKGQGLQIWIAKTDGSYDKYYYISDAYDEEGKISGEVEWEGDGWGDNLGDLVAKIPAKLGLAVWLVNGSVKDEIIPLAGEVSASDEKVNLVSGFQLAACPFPMGVSFETITWKNLSPVRLNEAKKGLGTQLWILNDDGNSYTKYYYLSDAYDEEGTISGEVEWEGDGWADNLGNLVAGKFLNAAQGMWVVSPGIDEANFKSPIK